MIGLTNQIAKNENIIKISCRRHSIISEKLCNENKNYIAFFSMLFFVSSFVSHAMEIASPKEEQIGTVNIKYTTSKIS